MSLINNDKVIHSRYFFGQEIPKKDLEDKRISYRTLSNAFDCILNNYIMEATSGVGDWEMVNGSLSYYWNNDACNRITPEEYEELPDNEQENYYEYQYQIFQYYIISQSGYEILSFFTDEVVFYNEELNMYLWGLTFYGTSWDYVSTGIQIDADDL